MFTLIIAGLLLQIPTETVWIPHFNSYCIGQKQSNGEYVVLQVLNQNQDPYGFLNWLNGTRAAYGLNPVGYDQELTNWAALNNNQQMIRGMGHFIMGPARRQNAALSSLSVISVGNMWMASPGHRAALLDPTITWIGIASAGAYWTFNGR